MDTREQRTRHVIAGAKAILLLQRNKVGDAHWELSNSGGLDESQIKLLLVRLGEAVAYDKVLRS